MVRRAVSLNGEYHAAGVSGVSSGKVNAVAGHTILRDEGNAGTRESVAHVDFERVQLGTDCQARAKELSAAGGELQVGAEHFCTLSSNGIRIYIVGSERADQSQPALRPSNGDVEAPFAALRVQWSPPIAHAAIGPLAVADGEDDRITFVTLNAFEVLYEEPFVTGFGKELV
jgi:hypothetical protein